MENISARLSSINWGHITEQMNEKGYALVPQFLNTEQCRELIQDYNNPAFYRKTVVMERHRFGLGEYKYFNYPLPGLIQTIREGVYPWLATIANAWMNALKNPLQFPATLQELQELCRMHQQTKPTVLILKYGKGGHNNLHQDLYGEIFFPIQLVLFLSSPAEDFKGGEFVLTQQTPRAQSKAMVMQPKKGDMLFFTTNFRPVKGSKGYYKVNMKHGVSEVLEGNRYTLGIIFHDALS
ncbi:MAG: Prolyl 4-hydroxylase subunit alpha [Ferruginibacter sp.]|nr:Prolyl 4-hydroxylase subunit alpha [Ferruginibacter sp.]